MAVAHSAASESHAATTGSVSQTSFSWTHTQTGTPQGVLVFVHVANSTGNPVSSVTYGSVTLTRVTGGAAIDSAGEAGRTDLFFAGSGLASGNQTITVNRANTTDIMYASAATVTAATNTNVTGIVLLQGDGALTVQSVTDGGAPTNSLRYAAAYSGLAAPPPAGTGSTLLNSIDFGNYGIALVRETTAGTGARNVGFNNATTDDRAAVHVAVRELWNRTDTETVGTFTLTGQPNTLAKGRVMTGECGAFALTGQPADLRHNPEIDGGTGTFTHTGRPADLRIGHAIASDVGKFFLPERNVQKQSEDFGAADWSKSNLSIAANATTAPDGTLTADALIENATQSVSHNISQNVTFVTGKTYTRSCYFKAYPGPTTRYARLQLGSTFVFNGTDVHANINLTTGQVINTPGLGATTSVTNAGNGWYRLSITLQYTGSGITSNPAIQIISTTSVGPYTDADGLSGIYVWGAQFEEATAATDYDPTGPAGATDATLRKAYRLDGGVGAFTFTGRAADTLHNVRIDGGTGALAFTGNDATLTEAAASKVLTADTGTFTLAGNPASTLVAVQLGGDVGKFFLPERNVLLRSEEFNQAAWGKVNATVSADVIAAPDGTITADRLVENTTSGEHFAEEALPVKTGNRYVLSCYAKGDGSGRSLVLRTALQGVAAVSFNLVNGTGSVNASNNLVSYGSTALADSWYRCWIVFDAIGTGTAVFRLQLYDNLGSFVYTGNGTASAYIWGAQLEEASAVSDYDPTGPAGATDTALRQQYNLTAEVGVFAHTGQPATLAKGRTITAETGTFTAAGQPATLLHNPRIEANTGSFALSGGAPALLRGRYLSGAAGEFIETGQPATFRRTWAVQAATGVFSFTGNPASLTELGAYEIDTIVGSFTLSGQPATLAQSQTMPITVGTFSFTGQPATLRQSQALAAETGSFATAGQPAALRQGYRLEAATGAFSFAGQPATLAKQSAKQLAADVGVFTLAGQQATLTVAHILAADRGLFTLTGQPATLLQDSALTTQVGTFTLVGQLASFGVARLLPVQAGAFALTGNSVALTEAGNFELIADAGVFVFTGQPASLTKASTARRRNVLIF